MASIMVILNHKITEDQKKDLQNNYSVNSFHFLPDELQAKLKQIDPEASLVQLQGSIIYPVIQEIKKVNPDYLWIQGESTVCFNIQTWCNNNGIILLTATTKREVQEVISCDGSTVKKSIFKHVRFRRLN